MQKKTAPSLFELQNWMKWRITPGELPAPRTDCFDSIVSDHIDSDDRLDVYSAAYISRIIENLEEDFKAVAGLFGEEKFADVVSDYIGAFPSTSPTVNDLGKSFAPFLLLHEFSISYPFLYELATFEWALCEALYASSNERASADSIAGVPESVFAHGRAICHPSVRLFKFEWPIDKIWKDKIEHSRKPVFILIHGANEKAYYQELKEKQFIALRFLQKGSTIEFAIEQSGFSDPIEIQESFSQWMSWGIFTGFDFSSEGCD